MENTTDNNQETAGKAAKRLTVESLAEQTDARFDEIIALLRAMQNKPSASFAPRIKDTIGVVYRFFTTMGLYKLVMVAVIVYVAYHFVPTIAARFHETVNTTQKTLAMNQAEYNLFQSAVSLVLNDIGEYNTIGSALTALYAELPGTIRDNVIDQLGTVESVSDLPDAMQTLLGRVVITSGNVPQSFSMPTEPILDETEPEPALIPQPSENAENAPKTPTLLRKRPLLRRRR